MRRDIASRKAPKADAVDLGPDNIFAQMGEPDADERHLKSTLVTRLRAAAVPGLPSGRRAAWQTRATRA